MQESKGPSNPLVPVTNPYPDQTPIRILSRQYAILEVPWGPSFEPIELPFPKLLLDKITFECALKTFTYFRADVELTIKMSSTPYHSGALLVSWLPGALEPMADVYQASGNNATILNASTQDSVTMVIPFISPNVWMFANATSFPSQLCRVYIHELVPLEAPSTVSDTVTLQVFARFINPKVAGFQLPSSAALPESQMAEAQAKMTNMSKTVPNAISGIIDTIPATVGAVLHTFDAVSTLLDLDKPVVSASPLPIFSETQFTHFNGKGVDTSVKGSLYPDAGLSNVDHMMGPLHSGQPLSLLAAQPMLYKKYKFTSKTDSLSIVAHPSIPADDGVDFKPDYLFHFSRVAALWRGSIKYHIMFVCNSFTSCRFRIGLTYSPYTSDCAYSGDIASSVVEVKGTTVFSCTVPFLYQNAWRTTLFDYTTGDFPVLFVAALDAPIGESRPADPSITCCVFRSGGPDMQFAWPTIKALPTPTEELESQTSLPGVFSKTFPTLVDDAHYSHEERHCTAEVIQTPIDLMRRYLDKTGLSPNDTHPATTPHPFIAHFVLSFRFWRGSRRTWLWIGPAAGMTVSEVDGLAGNSTPTLSMFGGGDNPISLEVPYYSDQPFQPIKTASFSGELPVSPPTIVATATATTWYTKVAAGDDFALGFLQAPSYYLGKVPTVTRKVRKPLVTRKT